MKSNKARHNMDRNKTSLIRIQGTQGLQSLYTSSASFRLFSRLPRKSVGYQWDTTPTLTLTTSKSFENPYFRRGKVGVGSEKLPLMLSSLPHRSDKGLSLINPKDNPTNLLNDLPIIPHTPAIHYPRLTLL